MFDQHVSEKSTPDAFRKQISWLALKELVSAIGIGAALVAATPSQAVTAPQEFTSLGGATIPDIGPGNPFPATVEVTGVSSITDLNVTITGLTHTWSADLHFMLRAPNGTMAYLMGRAGGGNRWQNNNVTFDDQASYFVPDSVNLGSMTVRPTVNTFLSVDPYSGVSNTSLGVFNGFTGSDVNGTWSLFSYDQVPSDSGSFSSFSLSITPPSLEETFSSLGGGAIPEFGQLDPFPIEIAVSGIRTISDLDVTLTGLSHTWSSDLNFLLQSPNGLTAHIMGGAGGGRGWTNSDLRFDQQITASIPNSEPLGTMRVQPTVYSRPNISPFAQNTNSSLDVFTGLTGSDVNGVWRLYGYDAASGDSGYLNGISLHILQAGASAVPEPASWTMMVSGFAMCGAAVRRRRSFRLDLGVKTLRGRHS